MNINSMNTKRRQNTAKQPTQQTKDMLLAITHRYVEGLKRNDNKQLQTTTPTT